MTNLAERFSLISGDSPTLYILQGIHFLFQIVMFQGLNVDLEVVRMFDWKFRTWLQSEVSSVFAGLMSHALRSLLPTPKGTKRMEDIWAHFDIISQLPHVSYIKSQNKISPEIYVNFFESWVWEVFCVKKDGWAINFIIILDKICLVYKLMKAEPLVS